MESKPYSRRSALKVLGASTILAAANPLKAESKDKDSPSQKKGAWTYKHSIGKVSLHILSDGGASFPAHPTFGGTVATSEEVEFVLKAHFRDPEFAHLELNTCLIESKEGLTLVDTGYGHRGREGTGYQLQSLKLAGFHPKDITNVVITHAHPDHIYGLTQKDGSLTYPNAFINISQEELNTWRKSSAEIEKMEEENNPLAGLVRNLKSIFDHADSAIKPIAMDAKLSTYAKAVPLNGHTPGHIGVMIESEQERLLVLGDLANHEVIATTQPDWPFGFDYDPAAAAAKRKETLQMVADQKLDVLGYHWSVPGLANIGKAGNAFRWYPKPMKIR